MSGGGGYITCSFCKVVIPGYSVCGCTQSHQNELLRTFDTGATRDTDEGKLDYEGFISPLVLECYAEYMHSNRMQSDGKMRDSDNWQRGIPRSAYMKSGWRHFFDWWKLHRGLNAECTVKVALCALMFNVMGYLHTLLEEGK